MSLVIFFIGSLLIIEISLVFIIRKSRSSFHWLITEKDEFPEINLIALEKFINTSFDPRLGWVRKPNSSGRENGKYGSITFNIDSNGSRMNKFNIGEPKIAAFGDSYTFCRQVEDDQTWEAHLAYEMNVAVLNYGVGNYGVDQALLRYEDMQLPESVDFVLMGFVPESICRVQSHWKHYLEFGNTFAFKPMFKFNKDRELKLLDNPIQSAKDFQNLESILPKIREVDIFYKNKFKFLQFRYPYLYTFLRSPKRHSKLVFAIAIRAFCRFFGKTFPNMENLPFALVMKENINHAHKLYNDKNSTDLLRQILRRFNAIAKKRNHIPILLVMPQLFDLKVIKSNNSKYKTFYQNLCDEIVVIDMTELFTKGDLTSLYINDQYGGHLSSEGNSIVARELKNKINEIMKNKDK